MSCEPAYDTAPVPTGDDADLRLIQGLSHGLAEFEVGNEQVGAAISLAAVVDWLNRKQTVMGVGLSKPLAKVVMPLADVANGKPSAFFTPHSPPHRPAHPTSDLHKALCAHAVDLLMKPGKRRLRRQAAGNYVAKRISLPNVSANTVLGWRDEMGSRNSQMAEDWYRKFDQHRKADTDDTISREKTVDQLLERLRDLV